MRKSLKPWFRKQTNAWYITHQGQQILLAKGRENRAEAMRAYHRFMLDQKLVRPHSTTVACCTVVEVLDLFLDHSQRHNQPTTYDLYRHFLQDFATTYPDLLVRDLKPLHVTRWLEQHPTWKTGSWGAVSALKRAFKWATDEGLLETNPLRSVKKPPMARRERILTRDEQEAFLHGAGDTCFRNFLIALRESGARPGEVAQVEAKMVDLANGTWTLTKHKTAKKTGTPRVIYLTPTLLELSRTLCGEHPSGPLFRNADGQPWTSNAIRCRFRRLRKKLNLGNDVVAYTFRHTYATDALENSVPAATVAELLGHSDLTMLMQHYSKLSEKREHLRHAARQATGKPANEA